MVLVFLNSTCYPTSVKKRGMSTVSINNLHSKFQPFLIGSPTCTANIKAEIDAVFQKPLTLLKNNYIFDAGNWVLKLGRTGSIVTTSDTHLYRVRKAEKIRSYIHQNNLEDHIAVPQKYLYWHAIQNQFYVVAEKMNLSPEVAQPASQEIEANFKRCGALYGGQMGALDQGASKRSLTPVQAKALAELSILGYTDLTYNNLYFTQDGKVAIIDTEPLKRSFKKLIKSNFLYFLLGDKEFVLTQQSIIGIAKLKTYTSDPTALQAVQKVEKNHALWMIARLIAKISAVTLAVYLTPTITAFIPIATMATTLKVSFIAIAFLKNFVFITNLLSVCMVWGLSCRGDVGLGILYDLEVKGLM